VRRLAELQLAVAIVAAALAVGVQPAQGFPREDWRARVAAAERYAEGRLGVVSFALVDARGRLHGYRAGAPVPTASLLKAMLLVGYLRMPSVRERGLTSQEKGLLGPMIRRSDNAAVAAILPRVGAERLYRLARLAGMTRFRLAWPVWGLSQTTARDQAHFFYRIDAHVPARHRGYALRLLRSIVPSQRWGVGRVQHPGWSLYFKGGWGSGTGLVDHQSALMTSRGARVALGVTTRFNPDHEYGKATLRGIARRLLGRLRPPAPAGSWLPF
jgi:Beta-lactamase enzyme family